MSSPSTREWIAVTERLPTQADADASGEVLVSTTAGTVKERGWRIVVAEYKEAQRRGRPCYFVNWRRAPISDAGTEDETRP